MISKKRQKSGRIRTEINFILIIFKDSDLQNLAIYLFAFLTLIKFKINLK
jgi:hypothetical protein